MLGWVGIDQPMKMRETSRGVDKKLHVNNNPKKKMRDIPKIKELYYNKGFENGCRQVFLDYIWQEQISMQLG